MVKILLHKCTTYSWTRLRKFEEIRSNIYSSNPQLNRAVFIISQMRSILRNHQIVRVIILSTYLFRRREKNSLFKILVYHCQLNHNLWSYQSSTTIVSSVHNKHMTYPICTYEFDSSFIKSSNKFSCLLERKWSKSHENSRSRRDAWSLRPYQTCMGHVRS